MSALRVSTPGMAPRLVDVDPPDPELALTLRQRRILAAVRMYGGNRSAAARHLGMHVTNVQIAMRRCRELGVTPPVGARRGRDLRPRKRS